MRKLHINLIAEKTGVSELTTEAEILDNGWLKTKQGNGFFYYPQSSIKWVAEDAVEVVVKKYRHVKKNLY